MVRTLILGLSLLATYSTVLGADVNFKIAGRGLPNMDIFNGSPDPYVKVLYSEGVSEVYKPDAVTQKLSSTKNPDFPDMLRKNFVVGARQRLRLEVWDVDIGHPDDYMGKVELTLAELANSKGVPLDKVIQGCTKADCGRLLITTA